ncbi:hypothetical protein [Desulfitobacterium sp.]|uniref:hypothetical protein n=1 Tax=Desulfitobacterium sp. TaxID=49981 RepID=UPI002B202821|nr:hypothetical protein [Desulfitobacterium sp.]MEA4900275.1 hypothetical protein [Desulfitobacterium sp.]
MKKSKLVAGILLMILGIGVAVGSVALHSYGYGPYGMMNSRHNIVNRPGMMGGYGFRVKPNQNQGQKSNPNSGTAPQPNQGQNNGQNGGTAQ